MKLPAQAPAPRVSKRKNLLEKYKRSAKLTDGVVPYRVYSGAGQARGTSDYRIPSPLVWGAESRTEDPMHLRLKAWSSGARTKNIESGIAALLTIVIVAAASLIIAISASLLGLGELDLGYTSQRGAEAFSVADGCMEETLRRMRLDVNYGIGVGVINLAVLNGSCTIEVVDLGSNQRRITITGTSGTFNKKIESEITISLGNVLSVDSWTEKDD